MPSCSITVHCPLIQDNDLFILFHFEHQYQHKWNQVQVLRHVVFSGRKRVNPVHFIYWLSNVQCFTISDSSPKLSSPSLSSPSSGNTTTTYSLPYYHNLYSRSQSNPQEGKKVHAVTYVPEVGTIPSPFAISPPAKDSKAIAKFENEDKRSPKNQSTEGYSLRNVLPASKTEDHKPDAFVIKSSHPLVKTETGNKSTVHESKLISTEERTNIDVVSHDKNSKDTNRSTSEVAIVSHRTTDNEKSYLRQENVSCVQQQSYETLKRRKSISPESIFLETKTIDLTKDKDSDVKGICDSLKSGDKLIPEIKNDQKKSRTIDTDNKIKPSAISSRPSSCASKVSEVPCDLNHNSKPEKKTYINGPESGNANKYSQINAFSSQPSPTEDTSDKTDRTKSSEKDSSVSSIPETTSDFTENEIGTKKSEQSESGQTTSKEEKTVKSKEADKGSSKDRRNHGTSAGI